jgi:signal transduction histidine kinase
MNGMPTHTPFGGLTIKTALLLGFGLTFGIWLVAGYYFTKRISETESRTIAINSRYMQAQELLSTVRAQVLLGSVYVRDALLDPDPAATDYRARVEETGEAANRALVEYVPVLDSTTERERLDRLQREIDDFRQTMLQVLATDRTRWRDDARVLLSTQVVPKRDVVIRVSEEVQALNRTAFVQQQREVADIYAASQRQLWESLGLALAASFGVAVLGAFYTGRLEKHLERQRLLDAQNARELQHLSTKLISAQEEERRIIARELHDEVGQVLAAVRVELAVAQRAIEANGGAARVLEDARSITEGALTTVRDLSHLLHPALLDDLGLPAAVEWYLQGFSRRYDIRAEVLHIRMEDRLAQEIEASAYRIIQEALTNIAKHARARACIVYIQRLATTIQITIEDDGAGFDANADSARPAGARGGLGLVSIRERVAQLRGSLRMESAPGKGSRITVELPARPRPVADDDGDANPPDTAVEMKPAVADA